MTNKEKMNALAATIMEEFLAKDGNVSPEEIEFYKGIKDLGLVMYNSAIDKDTKFVAAYLNYVNK